MKNCEVTIIQTDACNTRSLRYQFDNYRIAQALANILDNVCELEVGNDHCEWIPITKKVN